ncbi:unnamed protein product, partial [Lampetra planeri]
FQTALAPLSKALTMVRQDMVPALLCWPYSASEVDETRPGRLAALVDESLRLCRYPPSADAVCRYAGCEGFYKLSIYFTDPDFKGFVRLCCSLRCRVEFHPACWKKLKAPDFVDVDKDFLGHSCLTPDCRGRMCKIIIFGSDGVIKYEFEVTVEREKPPQRPCIKQRAVSARKLRRKLEVKQRRTPRGGSWGGAAALRHDPDQAVDHVVMQIASQRSLLLRCFSGPCRRRLLGPRRGLLRSLALRGAVARAELSAIAPHFTLLPAAVAGAETRGGGDEVVEGDPYDVQEDEEDVDEEEEDDDDDDGGDGGDGGGDGAVGRLLSLLVSDRDRVRARRFVWALACWCRRRLHADARLAAWATWLDSAGLKVTKSFLQTYQDLLEAVDLTPLQQHLTKRKVLTADDLKRLLPASGGDTAVGCRAVGCRGVVRLLLGKPAEVAREFVWLLAERAPLSAPLGHALDTYFSIMDVPCVVLQRSDHADEAILMRKTRKSKKKFKRESKNLLYISGSSTIRDDELDDLLAEQGMLDLMQELDEGESWAAGGPGGGPAGGASLFSVPEDLRAQLERFEAGLTLGLAAPGSSEAAAPPLLVDDPEGFPPLETPQQAEVTDGVREGLYDYFFHILAEHGPLHLDAPLLTDEFHAAFPLAAHALVASRGGLAPFLAASARFTVRRGVVALRSDVQVLRFEAHRLRSDAHPPPLRRSPPSAPRPPTPAATAFAPRPLTSRPRPSTRRKQRTSNGRATAIGTPATSVTSATSATPATPASGPAATGNAATPASRGTGRGPAANAPPPDPILEELDEGLSDDAFYSSDDGDGTGSSADSADSFPDMQLFHLDDIDDHDDDDGGGEGDGEEEEEEGDAAAAAAAALAEAFRDSPRPNLNPAAKEFTPGFYAPTSAGTDAGIAAAVTLTPPLSVLYPAIPVDGAGGLWQLLGLTPPPAPVPSVPSVPAPVTVATSPGEEEEETGPAAEMKSAGVQGELGRGDQERQLLLRRLEETQDKFQQARQEWRVELASLRDDLAESLKVPRVVSHNNNNNDSDDDDNNDNNNSHDNNSHNDNNDNNVNNSHNNNNVNSHNNNNDNNSHNDNNVNNNDNNSHNDNNNDNNSHNDNNVNNNDNNSHDNNSDDDDVNNNNNRSRAYLRNTPRPGR